MEGGSYAHCSERGVTARPHASHALAVRLAAGSAASQALCADRGTPLLLCALDRLDEFDRATRHRGSALSPVALVLWIARRFRADPDFFALFWVFRGEECAHQASVSVGALPCRRPFPLGDDSNTDFSPAPPVSGEPCCPFRRRGRREASRPFRQTAEKSKRKEALLQKRVTGRNRVQQDLNICSYLKPVCNLQIRF